ncbi:hypothetical protein BDR22DRAFT_817325 [Usnea florida]
MLAFMIARSGREVQSPSNPFIPIEIDFNTSNLSYENLSLAPVLETSNEDLDGILLAMERPALNHNGARQDVNVFERLLTSRLRLSPELASQILDHAAYWTTNRTPGPRDLTFYGSSPLLRTPPLGSTRYTMVDAGFGRMQARVAVRGENPAREIVVRWVGRRVRREEGQDRWTSGMRPIGGPEGADEGVRRLGGVFVVGAIRGVNEGWGAGGQEFGKGSFNLRGEKEEKGVLERERREMDVVFGEGLGGNEMEVGKMVWSWRDEGKGGELVRGLRVGDCLEVGSRLEGGWWGFRLEQMEVEVSYAI